MATTPEPKPAWKEIGRSVTTPTSKTERKEVKVDDYYVVVGFEVNNPSAFVDDVQNLDVSHGGDYGHAFFYVVKNKLITKVFSFGPSGKGKVGWFDQGSRYSVTNTGALIKDGYKSARPGTPDYGVTEKITAFKIALTHNQGRRLEVETDSLRSKIDSGKQKYTVWVNDTCAETARDLLSSAGVETPSGSGWIKYSGLLDKGSVYAVNPYMWAKNFSKSTSPKAEGNMTIDPTKWVGRPDPLF
jgi:hypothetical protein